MPFFSRQNSKPLNFKKDPKDFDFKKYLESDSPYFKNDGTNKYKKQMSFNRNKKLKF